MLQLYLYSNRWTNCSAHIFASVFFTKQRCQDDSYVPLLRLEEVQKSGPCLILIEDNNDQQSLISDPDDQIANNSSTNFFSRAEKREWNPAYAVFHHEHYLSAYQNRSFLKFDDSEEKQKLDKNILFCQNLLTSPPVIKEKDSDSEVVVFCFRTEFGTVFKIQWDIEDLNSWQHQLNQISARFAR